MSCTKMGKINVCTILNKPAANPGIAANQNNWSLSKVKPKPGNFTTITLIMNHEAKDKISDNVVIVNVFHAILLPVWFQNYHLLVPIYLAKCS